MVIVIVRWYIKNGYEDKFKITWEGMKPKSKGGLFGEFFSKPVDEPDDKFHTLDVESSHYKTYINVGLWRTVEDFENAIGSLIPGREQYFDSKGEKVQGKEAIVVYEFEFKLRERVVMNVEKTREGEWNLPDFNF